MICLSVLAVHAESREIAWRSGAEAVAGSRAEVGEAIAALFAEGVGSQGRPDTASVRHIVVQVDSVLSDEQRAALERGGLRVLHWLGTNTYSAAVRADADAAALRRAATVKTVSAWRREWKLHPALVEGRVPHWAVVVPEGPAGGGETWREDDAPVIGAYVLLHDDVVPAPDGAATVRRHGGVVKSVLRSVPGLVIELPRSRITALADEDAVLWIEPALPRFGEVNDANRHITQIETLQVDPMYGLDGAGVSVLVYDATGVDVTHADFGGRATQHDAVLPDLHATHVAGTVGGAGLASGGRFRGMAPGVRLESFSFQVNFDGTNIPFYADPGDLESDYDRGVNLFNVDVASNSIGTNVCANGFDCTITGDYGVASALIDAIARGSLGRSLPIVWSAGNERGCERCRGEGVHTAEGFRSVAPPSGAKNAIVVGAVNANDESMTPFSSWGPTDDGRIKPDLAAPGCEAGDDYGVTSCAPAGGYAAQCGTSMAAPTVAGAAALVIQAWREEQARRPEGMDSRNGNTGTPQRQHPNEPIAERSLDGAALGPSSAMVKALLLHAAEERGRPGPDYEFGFGVLRARGAVDALRAGQAADGAVGHAQAWSRLVRVLPGTPQLKFTLVWEDAPGIPNTARALVNDLDLLVFDPQGMRHFPWTLDPTRPRLPAVQTRTDHLNNVEQAMVRQPAAGLWLVRVHGYRVPAGPQGFAMVSSAGWESDCDGNGIDDALEIAADGSLDCTGNGLLDDCEPDCDGDGVADSCAIAAGATADCNGNEIPDACEADCNENGIADDCDGLSGSSADCDGDGVPDECQADCNTNHVADACDLATGLSADCDGDGVPDECQSQVEDCNANGRWDACDIAEGTSADGNGNGVPDACEPTGRTLFVNMNFCPRPHDGSVQHPFCTIQAGIDAALPGDVVVVAPGTYRGTENRNLDFGGKGITLRSAAPHDPVIVAATVIDAEFAGRGFYFHRGETREAMVDGLTIRRGLASLGTTPGELRGGGVYAVGSSPTIRRNVIIDNLVAPSFLGTFGGGGIYLSGSEALIDRCTIADNFTFNQGGGIHVTDGGRVVIRASRIERNHAGLGGGVVCAPDSEVVIEHTALVDNVAVASGGGGYVNRGTATLAGVTVTGNAAATGGGLLLADATMTMHSSIVWGNAAAVGREAALAAGAALDISYSAMTVAPPEAFADGASVLTAGEGMIDADPRLAGSAGSFHLTADSPCLDAGDPEYAAGAGETDADGEERVRYCRMDMGADESAFFADCDANGSPDACDVRDGTAADVNGNLVPDACETCATDEECDDGRYCNGPEVCAAGFCGAGLAPCGTGLCDESQEACVACLSDDDCDDRDRCTLNTCMDGACVFSPEPDCGPTVALRAAAINGLPLPGEVRASIEVAPGDVVTCEIVIEGWAPDLLSVYEVAIDAHGYGTSAIGRLTPVVEPTPSAGAFIDVARDDFAFADVPTVVGVNNTDEDYRYGALSVFAGVPDPGRPVYAGTLRLTVSDDAAGTFTVGPRTGNGVFLLDGRGNLLGPVHVSPVRVGVPVADCAEGIDCDDDGLDDDCALALGLEIDCNDNDAPDRCDIAAGVSFDCNGNGMPDECEADCNANGIPDDCDLRDSTSGDCNHNEVPDECEDCNGNEIADECELLNGLAADCNGNGVIDVCDIAAGDAPDCNGNGIPDECDIRTFQSTDCNGNGVPDECDVAAGNASDCNGNGLADICEDCNGNGLADECDLALGQSGDCDEDGVPDECQDCNGNGIGDGCEVADGTAPDCNGNGVPDDCEDCNGNGRADECDIADGTSEDRDRDGVPDECDRCAGVMCDDGLFCNGREFCERGVCRDGTPPCAGSLCDEARGRCVACLVDGDCTDGNDCTAEHCVGGVCAVALVSGTCHDGDRCTVGDVCLGGGCAGTPVEGCGARIELVAVAVNGIPLAGGPADMVQVAPGDEVTCEVRLSGWRPAELSQYTATLGAEGFTSGPRGTVAPVAEPRAANGAYIDETRSDFVFQGVTRLARVRRNMPDYRFYGKAVFEAASEAPTEKYGGTLVARVSADAAGAFTLGWRVGPEDSFLRDAQGNALESPVLAPLVIAVPPPGCAAGIDCDANGIEDGCDIALAGAPDCNGNGVPDACDVAKGGTREDCTGNGIPDVCEPDCNDNGIADSCDIAAGRSADCDGNGVPDECEDCNGNGQADGCDVATARSADCNANGVPDECDAAAGTSEDCNGNGVPDECERDCNGNGVADACELLAGTSVDADGNGVPDECQQTLRVPGDFANLQAALNAAQPGDTVLVAPGMYGGALNANLVFGGKAVTLRCDGLPGACMLDGGGTRTLLRFLSGETSTTRVEGFTLTGGTGLHSRGSSPSIRRCRIVNNPLRGVLLEQGSDVTLESCLIAGNRGANGAGLFAHFSRARLRNCTMAGNQASIFGGGLYGDHGEFVLESSIVWGNMAPAGRSADLRFGSLMFAAYSIVEGTGGGVHLIASSFVEGAGNADADPLFVAPVSGDYRLALSSRAIDGGNPTYVPEAGETDLAGEARLSFHAVDMGAFEAEAFLDCNGNGRTDWHDVNLGPAAGGSLDCNGNGVPDECDGSLVDIVFSDPPHGAIDARQPSDVSGSSPSGWDTIQVTLGTESASLTQADLVIMQEGGVERVPFVRSVTATAPGVFHVRFDKRISPGAWTTVAPKCGQGAVRVGYLPGDVDGDGVSTARDILRLVDALNQLTTLPPWSTDVDRSGATNSQDLLRLIDLLNGAGAYEAWNGRRLP